MASDFDPGNLFGGRGPDPTQEAIDVLKRAMDRARKQRKPLPQIRGKRIDGVLYVRAEDVADALESQVPVAAKPLIRKLRGS